MDRITLEYALNSVPLGSVDSCIIEDARKGHRFMVNGYMFAPISVNFQTDWRHQPTLIVRGVRDRAMGESSYCLTRAEMCDRILGGSVEGYVKTWAADLGLLKEKTPSLDINIKIEDNGDVSLRQINLNRSTK